jgi:hypothetical protein
VEAGVDEVFIEAEDLVGSGGLDDLSGRGECGGEESGSLFALEVDEVFDKRASGVTGDGVWDARAVGKEGASGEVVRVAGEFDGTVAAGDEFDRHVGKLFSSEAVIRGAILDAAADDRDGFCRSGREVEKEAAGFGDL